MKLKEACEIGYACGCETIKEAILNVELHCGSLFKYDDATLDLYELQEDAAPYDHNMKILSLFPEFKE